MSSYITENRSALKVNHYIRQATSDNYWVDFQKGKLDKYIERKGTDFCLVINGSTKLNDDYILPYKAISHLLTKEYYSPNRPRWIFTINNNILHIPGKETSISVTAYYNAFQLLDDNEINRMAIENDVTFPKEIDEWDLMLSAQ